MSCDCLELARKSLAEFNTRPVVAFTLSDGKERTVIATMRIRSLRDGKSAKTLLATYCPMCGEKYEP